VDSEAACSGFIVGELSAERYFPKAAHLLLPPQHMVEQTSRYTHKIPKALRLMNIRLDVAIRGITSKAGRAIIEAILSGNRHPQYLASLVDVRRKKLQVK
jgi:hypothetical protein